LSINVLSTAGGVISVSDGVVDQIDTLLSGLLGSDNPLDSRINSLQSQAEDITEDRAVLEVRLDAIEARYRRQFNALDSLLSELNSSGSFIADQLANIPVPGTRKK
jgi:flagellar hook-associated protein 2